MNKRLQSFDGEAEGKEGLSQGSHDLTSLRVRTAGLLAFISVLAALFSGWGSTVGRTGGVADWPAYGRDPGGSRYSPLTEINRGNVKTLRVAWTHRTGAAGQKANSARKAAFEATPILVDGTLYLSTPLSRVIALDPETGAERWIFDPKVDLSQPYSEVTSRGVSTWVDRKGGITGRRRVYVTTLDARLIALDAATGVLCKGFGEGGRVDLTRDVRLVDRGDYQVTSPPAVIGDLIVVGSAIGDNRGVKLERGVVRAYDARAGKLRWSWDPIPQQATDPARKTWAGDSAARTGAANAWSMISADPERGLVFVPTSSPSPDFYGGERKGSNLYANAVVALQASTGKVVWHFQAVHHDLWDYDVASQPVLVSVKLAGREIPAVAVATKVGHLFLLHRETGDPLFPVEERPVPRSTVPGEEASPTQPFPKLPPALVPQKLTPEDAWGVTPADREWCRERIKTLRSDGVFTPPSLEGTVVFPGNAGGVNWGGMSYDPERGLLIASTNRLATVVKLIPRQDYDKLGSSGERNRFKGEFGPQTGTPYAMHREFLLAPGGAPCNQPPWGVLTAVDLATGVVRWEVPLGTMPQLSKFPESPQWGSINLGGSAVTGGGLIFIAAAMDNFFRAFDVETGKELWRAELPASAQATPMTYRLSENGRQFVVIAAGGHGKLGTKMGDYVVAFTLP
jgi:quinoprotein glucose dehydrogenase